MKPVALLSILLAAATALALEDRFPPALRLRGEGPDLLLAAAVFAAARRDGSLVQAVLLGILRDAVAGGVAGRFAGGFLVAASAARALFAESEGCGLCLACAATFAGAVASHALAGAVSGLLGREVLQGLPLRALASGVESAVFAPAVVVPLAALDTLFGVRKKIELGAS